MAFIMTNFTPADMPNAKASAAPKAEPKKASTSSKGKKSKNEDAQTSLETLSSAPEAESMGENE